jgi:two-component system, chemotaxis family, protein-glutamate methylesterase/glutaminase
MRSAPPAGARAEPPWLVAVAASAGGIPALGELLRALPASFPAAVLVVVHLEPHRVSHLAQVLDRASALPVSQAVAGERPLPGRVYVAPPDRHLMVAPDGLLRLADTPREHYSRPSADPLFASVAAFSGARAVAVVLSGMGSDGSLGAAEVARRGGTVLAQDASALYGSMPAAAVATGGVAHVLSPGAMAPLLTTLVNPGG